MRTPIAERTTAVSPAVNASVDGEYAVAKAVALLHILSTREHSRIDDLTDSYIDSGLAALANESMADLVKAFDQLDAVASGRNQL